MKDFNLRALVITVSYCNNYGTVMPADCYLDSRIFIIFTVVRS